MAGIQLNATAKDLGIEKTLEKIARTMSNMTPLMRAIGEDVLEHAKRNFDRESTPDGTPWVKSQRAEREGGKTLQDRRILYNSLHAQAGKDQVSVGTADKRAGVLHEGAKKGEFGSGPVTYPAHTRRIRGREVQVPAMTRLNVNFPWGDIPGRAFLGLSNELIADVEETALDFLSKGA